MHGFGSARRYRDAKQAVRGGPEALGGGPAGHGAAGRGGTRRRVVGDLTAEPREVDYTWRSRRAAEPAMWLVPKRARTDRVLLCLHGGGFVGGSIYTHRKMFGHLAKATGVRALLVGYRLLPEGGGYPVPVDEGEAAYRWLLEQGTETGHIAFARRFCRRLAGDHRAAPAPGPRGLPLPARGPAHVAGQRPGGRRRVV